MVSMEIACGTPPAPRERTLSDLRHLRSATVANIEETLALIEREQLQDSGCGVQVVTSCEIPWLSLGRDKQGGQKVWRGLCGCVKEASWAVTRASKNASDLQFGVSPHPVAKSLRGAVRLTR